MAEGLAIGSGLARGAAAFIKNFQQGQDRERAQKLQEAEPILRAIYSSLEDDTVPLNERIKIVKNLPSVLKGAGLNVRMSGDELVQMMGLDGLAQQEIDTGEIVYEDAVQVTPNTREDSPMTEIKIPRGTKKVKRGEVSQMQLKDIFQRISKRAEGQDTLARQKELETHSAEEQLRVQKEKGYRVVDKVIDEDGDLFFISINETAEPGDRTRFVNVSGATDQRGHLKDKPKGKTKTVSMYNTEARGAGGGTSTIKNARFRAQQELEASLGRMPTDEEIDDLASKKIEEDVRIRLQGVQAGTGEKQVRTEIGKATLGGTLPASQTSTEGREQAREFRIATQEGLVREKEEDLVDSESEIKTAQDEVNEAQAAMDDLLSKGYDTEDSQVKDAKRYLDASKRRLKATQDKQSKIKGRLEGARKTLESLQKGISNTIQRNPKLEAYAKEKGITYEEAVNRFNQFRKNKK